MTNILKFPTPFKYAAVATRENPDDIIHVEYFQVEPSEEMLDNVHEKLLDSYDDFFLDVYSFEEIMESLQGKADDQGTL